MRSSKFILRPCFAGMLKINLRAKVISRVGTSWQYSPVFAYFVLEVFLSVKFSFNLYVQSGRAGRLRRPTEYQLWVGFADP